MKIKEAFSRWNSEIKPAVIAQYSADDEPALSESWNDFTEYLCKDGELTDTQYHYCPSWDGEIPDADDEPAWLLEQMGVTFDITSIIERPDGIGEWGNGAPHWKVYVRRGAWGFPVFYSMGSAHKGEPEGANVFNSLLMDTSDTDTSFEDWADNMGLDSDSRKAERIFEACKETERSLSEMFTAGEIRDLRETFSDM